MGFLQGKKILITGMISERSIAYGIAKACRTWSNLSISFSPLFTPFVAQPWA